MFPLISEVQKKLSIRLFYVLKDGEFFHAARVCEAKIMPAEKSFHFVSYAIRPFERDDMYAFHASMFRGQQLGEKYARYPALGNKPSSLKLAKNLYNLADVFVPTTNLVVSDAVRSLLTSLPCSVDFVQVTFQQPFLYPYRLGDFTYSDDFPRGTMEDDIIEGVAKRHACGPPSEAFYEVLTHKAESLAPDYADTNLRVVAQDVNYIDPKEVHVSAKMLEDHGIVWDCGFLLRSDVFHQLDPFLTRPFFWCGEYSF